MENLKQMLLDLANESAIPTTINEKKQTSSLQQTYRNNLKNELAEELTDALVGVLTDELIQVVRLKEGVGIVVDNEKVGFIPIKISIAIPSLEEDLVDMSEEFAVSQADKKAKAKEKAQSKAKKIEIDQELRNQRLNRA